jgi:hypothetical protein
LPTILLTMTSLHPRRGVSNRFRNQTSNDDKELAMILLSPDFIRNCEFWYTLNLGEKPADISQSQRTHRTTGIDLPFQTLSEVEFVRCKRWTRKPLS